MSVDVFVVGLMTPTCVLGDIGMDVPHGRMVAIPGELALVSKDLWRCIGQRSIMRLLGGPGCAFPPVLGEAANTDTLIHRTEALEAENHQLKETVQAHTQKLERLEKETDDKLGRILALLSTGHGPHSPVSHGVPVLASSDLVDGSAPVFIPATVAPSKSTVRIGASQTEADTKGVSEAATKLRSIRQARQ